MNILAAIKREERKLEKQLHKVQYQLDGIRAAAKALGHTTGRELGRVKKQVMPELPHNPSSEDFRLKTSRAFAGSSPS